MVSSSFPVPSLNVFPSGMHRPAVSGLEQDSPAFDTDIRLFFGAVTRKGFQHPACDHPVEVLLIKRQFAGYVFRYDDAWCPVTLPSSAARADSALPSGVSA